MTTSLRFLIATLSLLSMLYIYSYNSKSTVKPVAAGISYLDCECRNDAPINSREGSFTSTIVISDPMMPLVQGRTYRVLTSSGLYQSTSNNSPVGQDFVYCDGTGCPSGVTSGQYYLDVVVRSSNNFSIAVDTSSNQSADLTLSNESCMMYPELPVSPFADQQCLLESTTFAAPANTGLYVNNRTTNTNLYPGFTREPNGDITVDPFALEATGNPYSLFLIKDVMGCKVTATDTFNIYPMPRADLVDRSYSCLSAGAKINLSGMFKNDSTSAGGVFSVNGVSLNTIDSTLYQIDNPGCYTVSYEINGECPTVSDTKNLLVTFAPEANFEIAEQSQSPVCLYGSQMTTININISSQGTDPDFTITPTPQSVSGSASSGSMTATFGAPTEGNDVIYELCYSIGTDLNVPTCGGLAAPAEQCRDTLCRKFIVYNDGYDCGANNIFDSQCPEPFEPEVCEAEANPTFELSCSFFSLAVPFDFFTSELEFDKGVYTCEDAEITGRYVVSVAGLDPDKLDGGKKIKDFPGISIICDVFNFCICIDVGITSIEIRPFSSLYDALGCDRTITQVIAGILSKLLGGDGGGALVVADTDGDGAFDFEIYNGDFPASDNFSIPNRLNNNGYITVRAIGGFPNSPISECGQLVPDGADLLELLPIGSIPIVGPTIEDLLAAAQCGVNLGFSSEVTESVVVKNDGPPEFLNCNTSGYVFTNTLECENAANWSVPAAVEACSESSITYKGVTSAVDLSFYQGNDAPTPVMLDGPGLYQTAGPLPGSVLPIGNYTVSYVAVGCNGNPATCEFDVIVQSGNPMLECPSDIQVNTDSDVCTAAIFGTIPRQGIGCSSIINYSYVNPVSGNTVSSSNTAAGQHSYPEGNAFEVGMTEVTYTMQVDINGDGDFDDTVSGAPETQECSFTVTVSDNQYPLPLCNDVEVQLDNSGSVTVYAAMTPSGAYLDGGSSDNCGIESITIAKTGDTTFAESVSFDCSEIGQNYVRLRVIDNSGNEAFCSSIVNVTNFFDDYQLFLDAPELCLEASNPEQLTFTNYLDIVNPNGQEVQHENVGNIGSGVYGVFAITAFLPSDGNTGTTMGTSPASPGHIGYIDAMTGVYTPGTGSGFVTISYLLGISDQVEEGVFGIEGCYKIVHETFELKRPLTMDSPECECLDVNFRAVDLGVVSGGLEPYRLEYTGGVLDLDRDGTPDDTDGIYTYDAEAGYNIEDIQEDLGRLLLNYTTPAWSITVVDARGCEIARSGSCDNPDLASGPEIDCRGVNDFDSEVRICERQYSWMHAIPYDNCAVTQYSYTVTNPDGTISGPFTLDALIDDANTGIPLSELQRAEYDFEEGVSVITYYAEDAVGNIGTCSFNVSVSDNDPPTFLNCPMPDVIVNTETGECDAYVNFALPIAEDNCGNPIAVEQIDDSGLSSGSRFPIGTTILTFRAKDHVGNKTICKMKVIVNDYSNAPTITCPQDRVVSNDQWLCTAEVNNIGALAQDLCSDNLTTVWQIEHDGGVIGSGMLDASGFIFPEGVSTVTYKVQDQPLLLISEVSQDADHLLGGMNPPPFTNGFQCLSNLIDTLGNGDVGEGLTFYPVDGRFYHTSGASDGNEYFEEIFLDPYFCVQPNHAVSATYGPPTAGEVTGIVYDVSLEKFVLMDTDRNIFQSSTTGVFTQLSTYSGANPLRGFAYVGGNIYGVDPVTNELVQFNRNDGSVVSVVATTVTGLQGITHNTSNGQTYVIYNNGGSDSFVGTIDLNSGAVTEIGNTGQEFAAIAFDANGVLHGVSSDNAAVPSGLYQIYCQNPGDDYVEITNFGASTYDISCLTIERTLPSGSVETFTVPEYTVLAPGSVFALHYGPGIDQPVGPNYLFNMPSGTDVAAGDQAVYKIYYNENQIDEITMFADANAGIVRTNIFDSDAAADFALAEDCEALSIGMYNPYYPVSYDNGSRTSLQSQPAAKAECSFTITVEDVEPPKCMELEENGAFSYVGAGFEAVEGECNQYIINIPEANNCIIEDLNVNIKGEVVNSEFITMTLRSPSGNELVLYDGGCNTSSSAVNVTFDDESDDVYSAMCASWQGSVRPQTGMLMEFFTDKSAGEWVLDVYVEAGNNASFDITEWTISGTCLTPWEMEDVTLDNDVDECGAEFTWIHPFFADNCKEGTIRVDYFSDDVPEIEVPESGLLADNFGKGGFEVTEFFVVGTTTVRYTLVDAAGNMSQCSFDVTVKDVQDPVITICPDDIFVQLGGGECRTSVNFYYDAEDNCSVDSLVATPASGSLFEIGETEVVIVATDPAGNTDTCRFLVVVAEFIPASNELTCNNEINVSLDVNCEAVLGADMLLEGNNYRCYENYCIEIEDAKGDPHPNQFDRSDAGQRFKVSIVDCMNPEEPQNTCWGYVNIEEKFAPDIKCPDTYYLSCNQSPDSRDTDGKLITGEVEILNCEPFAEITYADIIEDYDNCNDPRRKIIRTWRVEDEHGNVTECNQEIFIKPLSLDDIVFPADISFDNALDCYDVSSNPDLLNPMNTGYPQVNGVNVNNAGSLCMISRNYRDEIYDICNGSYEVLRIWKIRNMCLPASSDNPREHTQIIKVLDNNKPKFNDCPMDTIVSTKSWSCLADATLPLPEQMFDHCSNITFNAQIFGGGTIETEGYLANGTFKVIGKNMKVGDHRVIYTVEDECGNTNSCEFNVEVKDISAPTAIARQKVVLSLSNGGENNSGIAKLYATQIDNGSYDGCSDTVHVEIMRVDGNTESCTNDGVDGFNNNNTYNNDGHVGDDPRDTDNGAYVKFCCADASKLVVDANGDDVIDSLDRGYIPVMLRVWDDGDMNQEFGSAGDNYSEINALVKVENKLPPLLTCPQDTVVQCDAGIVLSTSIGSGFVSAVGVDFSHTGSATARDICGDVPLQFKDNTSGLNSCGVGTVVRTWRVESGIHTIVCDQEIRFEEGTNVFEVTAPSQNLYDWDYCSLTEKMIPDNHMPRLHEGSCSNIGVNISIDTFFFEEGVCKKWAVSYKYKNWCDGEEKGPYVVYYKYTDKTNPTFVDCGDQIYGVDGDCNIDLTLHKVATDANECTSDGWLKWNVYLDAFGDGMIEYYCSSYKSNTEWRAVPKFTSGGLLNPEWQNLPSGYIYAETVYVKGIESTVSGEELEISVGLLSGGSHKVHWTVTDGCHNDAVCTDRIEVVDDKAPTPYCVELSTALMYGPDKWVELWAQEFDKGASDNCTPKDRLGFTFYGSEPQWQDTVIERGGLTYIVNASVPHYFDEANSFVDFKSDGLTAWTDGVVYPKTKQATIDRYYEGVKEDRTGLQVWRPADRSSGAIFTEAKEWNVECAVWDEAGNSDYCSVPLTVTDNEGSTGTLGGHIEFADGSDLEGVEIEVRSALAEYPRVAQSTENGQYELPGNPLGAEYSLVARKSMEFREGLNTRDLLAIQRHILNLKKFTSPYEVIASDVNGNNNIEPRDLLLMRKLILRLESEVEGMTSFRFVDKNVVYANIYRPWPVVEQIEVGRLTNDALNNDFIAVKVGDVNNSAKVRDAVPAKLGIEDRYVEVGEVIEVEVSNASAEILYGGQYTLAARGMEYTGVEGGVLKEGNFMVNSGDGACSMLFTSPRGIAGNTAGLFVLRYQVTESGWLSDKLSLVADGLVPAEGYVSNESEGVDTRDIVLDYGTEDVAENILYQNEPNPFRDNTEIGYVIAEAGEVTLEVSDVTGRVLYTWTGKQEAGSHSMVLEKETLGGVTGVLYYRIESGDWASTKKMISVK